MHAASSLILNATKHLAGLPDKMYRCLKTLSILSNTSKKTFSTAKW